MKNILVTTASLKLKGNCSILADVFMEEAVKGSHHVTRLDAGQKHISGCMAYEGCWKVGRSCV